MFRATRCRLLAWAGLAGLALAGVLCAQTTPKPAYDFSLPREERVKLAESAAPPEVSGKASLYLLERTGYLEVRDGSNGFSCFVDRQTPLNQEPTCFDAEGSSTTLLTRIFVEEQRAAGKKGRGNHCRAAGRLQERKISGAAQARHRLHDVDLWLLAGARTEPAR
jgi:hypothetical protein